MSLSIRRIFIRKSSKIKGFRRIYENMMCVEIAKEMSLDMGNAITDTTTFIIARAKTMGAKSARKNLPESPRTRGFLFLAKIC